MQHYQIRIIAPTGAIRLIYHDSYWDDVSSVNAAKILCRGDDRTEVWRGDVCVHRPIQDQPSDGRPDHRAA